MMGVDGKNKRLMDLNCLLLFEMYFLLWDFIFVFVEFFFEEMEMVLVIIKGVLLNLWFVKILDILWFGGYDVLKF